MRQMAFLGAFQPQALGEQLNLQINQFITPLLINVTGPTSGFFLSAGIYIATNNIGSLGSALDVGLEYAFDGATSPTAIPLFDFSGGVNRFSQKALGLSWDRQGDGTAIGDFMSLWLGIPFQYAAVLRLNCNAAPDSGTARRAHFVASYAIEP